MCKQDSWEGSISLKIPSIFRDSTGMISTKEKWSHPTFLGSLEAEILPNMPKYKATH